MRKRQIVFVNRFFSPDLSATSQVLSDLAFYLSSQGMHIKVVTSRQCYDRAAASLPVNEEIKGVSVFRVRATSFGRANLFGRSLDYLSFYAASFFCLLRILHSGDIVVAKTDPPLISVIALAASKLRGAKLINWTQDIFPEVATTLRVKAVLLFAGIFKWLRNWSFRNAEMNVAIGNKMASVIRDQHVDSARVTVIHNWSDGSKIKPVAPAQNRLRSQWGLDGKFVVGYSGNMGRAHEFETILEAASLLSDDKNIIFLLIGDGKQRELIESSCARKNIKNIIFKPFQPYEVLCESLTAADAHLVCLKPELEGYIVPSKTYGVMASGRPILNIGADEGEIGTLIRKIGCGYSFKVGQSAELAGQIRLWSRQPAAAEVMGRAGREFFEKNFDSTLGLKAWYDVLLKYAN